MTPARLELSAMGAVRPPGAAAVDAAARREAQGFDAVWWADHLHHWFPPAIWTPDLVPQAATQASPHVWFDPVPVIAQAAQATRTIGLGLGVTDMVRRHPASLAQTALTLDHLTGGRFVLGVGAGESLNLDPFGMEHDLRIRRLEEGIEVMRMLMREPGPLDYRGEVFVLHGACMGLAPVGEAPPAIWVAAHRPRGLAVVAQWADGWLPLGTDPEVYGGWLASIRTLEQSFRRAPGSVTAGAYCRVVLAPTAAEAVRILDDSLLMRFIALTRSAEEYAARGFEHPLGAGAFGLTDFVPTDLDREAALGYCDRVPAEMVRSTVIHGTPDDVADRVLAFHRAGAEHVQLTNMTPLAAPARAAESEALLGDVVAILRDHAAAAA